MGVILAKFRREKTTYQLLEQLEEKIKTIEELSNSTQEQQKRFVGNFLVVSIGLYIISFAVFYFLFFPPTWLQRLAYMTPLVIFPLVIIFLKRLFALYYQKILKRNSTKLNGLRAEKRKIIEKVMDTETYKVAVDIISRFGDASNVNRSGLGAASPFRPLVSHSPTTHSAAAVRQRSLQVQPQTPVRPIPFQSTMSQPHTSGPRTLIHHSSASQTPFAARNIAPDAAQLRTPNNALAVVEQLQTTQTPFPIINFSSKNYLEKFVDFLVGDGISTRYGMICKECLEHNGMASLEEYEYSAFRCAFCKTLNSARKLRPVGPKISTASDDANRSVASIRANDGANDSTNGHSTDTSSASDSEDPTNANVTAARPVYDELSSDVEKTQILKKHE